MDTLTDTTNFALLKNSKLSDVNLWAPVGASSNTCAMYALDWSIGLDKQERIQQDRYRLSRPMDQSSAYISHVLLEAPTTDSALFLAQP
eukprot:5938416-Pyramimonas_sp.AAC.1